MSEEQTALVLRTCCADGSSRGGFVWPKSGPVECPPQGADPGAHWDPYPKCGNGLHGALWGEGEGSFLDWSSDARWLVVRVLVADVVDLRGKVKFPRGWVEHCGDREGATRYLVEHGGAGRAVIGVSLTGGDHSTLTGWWWDGRRRRLAVAYVGEDGIEAGVPYRVERGRFVRGEVK